MRAEEDEITTLVVVCLCRHMIPGQILDRRTLRGKAQLCHLVWHYFALELQSPDSLDDSATTSYASIKQFGIYIQQPFSRPIISWRVYLRYITAYAWSSSSSIGGLVVKLAVAIRRSSSDNVGQPRVRFPADAHMHCSFMSVSLLLSGETSR